MGKEYKKITVLIVTYKQADVIGRNLDSILQQKEYGLHEIVVCDDCSPDNNWDVIQSYVEKYPNIIRAYRNNPNLGIYGNSDKCASLHGDADLFCWLEGDDALEDGFFKGVQEYIEEKGVDVTAKVGIFCDYSTIDKKGEKRSFSNSKIESKHHPMSLYLRQQVSWRASLFSRGVIEQFKPTKLDMGLRLAEALFDSQWFRYVDKVYHCNILGSLYYTGIGVSVNLGQDSSYRKEEALTKWMYFLENEIFAERKDVYWIRFKINESICFTHKKFLALFKSVYYYCLGAYQGMSVRNNLVPLIRVVFLRK